MGFRTGAYATCWSVEQGRGNFTKVRLSISRKNREGVYEQDFSGFCMFIGTAHAKAEKLKERDRIKLGDVDVSTTFNKEQNKEYVNYKVFDFEPVESNYSNNRSNNASSGGNPVEGDSDEDNLPF